jgi:hypothetical protein
MTYSGKFAVLMLGLLGGNLVLAASAKETPKHLEARKHRSAASSQKNKPAAIVPAPVPLTQVPVFTPPPLRPGQMPAVPPRISYQGGQLTVVAENSNFSDVLNGIRTATGMRIESTGGTGGERVAAKIGPAPVRDVLLSLLEGSRFDFVLMGSATDPDRIERVLLSPKAPEGTATANGAPRPAPTPNADEAAQEETETDNSDDNAGFAPAPVAPAATAPSSQPQPPAAAPGGQPGTTPDQGVKTPEQLLQDLRNMEQQRQQQQQQQQGPATSPDQVQRPPRTQRPPQ